MAIGKELAQALGETQTVELQKQIRRWARLWTVPSLPKLVEIRPNFRLSTTVARYRRDQRAIEVGARFLAQRQFKAEVLAHEMAHAVVDLRYGRIARPHGKEWQELVIAAGYSPTVRLRTVRLPPPQPRVARSSAYVHRCPVCQMARISRRPVTGWRCRGCVQAGLPGNLKITRTVFAR